MSFAITKKPTVIVEFDNNGENLLGIKLYDGTALYAEDYERTDRQLVYPVDLLPADVRDCLRDCLREVYEASSDDELESAMTECLVTHFDPLVVQSNILYDLRIGGWRINVGDEMPVLRFFGGALRGVGENVFGGIGLDSPIKEVFVTTRAALGKD
jgi:hypothetical protein